AVSSALTGHFVLSTLHTNDAPSAITRLTDMGIKPFLIASSIQAIAAQRLVRVLCPKCKVSFRISEEVLNSMGLSSEALGSDEMSHGAGCESCGQTGYSGRTIILELMCVTPDLRKAIHGKASIDDLRKIACENGMTTLMEDGLRLVRNQTTSLEEILRVSAN
ncbi:MAG: Flp pilus assembly complex ATPase component, partial [Planctomycetes bacterium]|nr:Flp pilus assembly complex ATPase component [Planctomycetota bacterium]